MQETIEQKSKLISGLTSPDRFTLLEDGWIKDDFVGVEWGPSSEETMEFKEAKEYCEELGARLPELHELHSLVNFLKDVPAAYDIFKDTKHDAWYWSGTKTSWRSDALWCVAVDYGDVGSGYEDYTSYVRPVRPCKC